jgi:hypothetical protein
MLTGFTNTNTPRRGRFIKLEYAEAESFEPYIRAVNANNLLMSGLTFKAGQSWKTMPLVIHAPTPYVISERNVEQGSITETQASGTLRDTSVAVLAEAKRLQGCDLVIRLTLQNGQKILISDPIYPATFIHNTEGGSVGVELQKLKFSFKAEMPNTVVQLP